MRAWFTGFSLAAAAHLLGACAADAGSAPHDHPDVVCDDAYRCIASLPGVLLHEMAHLAGATFWDDPITWGNLKGYVEGWPQVTHSIAEAYHYYVLNLPTW